MPTIDFYEEIKMLPFVNKTNIEKFLYSSQQSSEVLQRAGIYDEKRFVDALLTKIDDEIYKEIKYLVPFRDFAELRTVLEKNYIDLKL